ncbi:MAG: acyltransferase [Burkholderiales bacterium]|nr:acyltransferase [Burkholderiales bacterium]
MGGDPLLVKPSLNYRPDIDGLRAIAVLSVVAYHAAPSIIRGGFIGVDIFFVISGFLITRIVLEGMHHGEFTLVGFYSRRVNRIFPALAIVLAATYLTGWVVLFADEYKNLGKHIAAGAAFLSNIALIKESGYFDASADTKPLLHLWSLGVEEQFYFIWPALLWLAWKRRIPVGIVIASLAIVSIYLNLRGVKNDSTATFYSPQTRFWELACGGLLAWVGVRKQIGLNTRQASLVKWGREGVSSYLSGNLIASAGSLLIAYGLLTVNHNVPFPGKWAFIPVAGAVLVIAAGPNAWINRIILSNRLVIWFGLISFPLYLWHWPLLTFLRIGQGGELSALVRALVVTLSIFLAWLTYRFVETGIRRNQHRTWQTVALFVTVVTMGGLGAHAYINAGFPDRAIAKKSKDFDYSEEVPNYIPCDQSMLIDSAKKLNYCLKPKSGQANAVIIGDSHAEDKIHGLASVDVKRK